MWVLIAEIGVEVALWGMNKLLSDPPPDNRAKDLTSQPTTNEGGTLPLVFGRARVKQPGLVWYNGFESVSDSQVNGGSDVSEPNRFYYGINMLYVVGIPMGPLATGPSITNTLAGIYSGDSFTPLNLQHGQSAQTATNPNLGTFVNNFGLGIGRIHFAGGASDQDLIVSRDIISGALISPTPLDMLRNGTDPTTTNGYRNQMCVAMVGLGVNNLSPSSPLGLRSFDLGANATIPPHSFEVISAYRWLGEAVSPSGDANPASVIYDVLIKAYGGMNLPTTSIDVGSLVAAAAILDSEGNLCSGVLDQGTDAKSFLQALMQQINGSLYQDPYTGLMTLKLIRGGYDVSDHVAVPLFTPADIIEFAEFQVGAWTDVANVVRVKYPSRDNGYQDTISVAQNMASAVLYDAASLTGAPAGKIRAVDMQYPYCCLAALADSIAQRDLNALSQPLAKGQLILKRRAHTLRPGDVFQVTFPEYFAGTMVFRATKVDLGQLGDNRVTVDFVQDPYQASSAGYGTIVTAIPITPPEPLSVRKLTESPYWLMAQAAAQGKINSADVQRILALAAPDDAATQFEELTLDPSLGTNNLDIPMTSFPLTSTVGASYGRVLSPYDTTTGLVLGVVNAATAAYLGLATWTHDDIHTYGRSLILVGDEIMAYESAAFALGVWTLQNVWRGLLGTAARDHVVGERIYWIAPRAGGLSFVGRLGWQNVITQATAIPRLGIITGSGEDPVDTIGIQLRGSLPACVGDFELAGEVIAGTTGLPVATAPSPLTGFFRAVSRLEEGLAYYFLMRDRKLATVSRGDEPIETPSDTDPTTVDLYVQKLGTGTMPSAQANGAPVKTVEAIDLTASTANSAIGIAGGGYGDLDVIAQVKRVSPAGAHGIPPAVTSLNWDSQKVRVRAERWRSLLGNARFDFHGAGTDITPAWVVESGVPKTGQSTSSITKVATDCYLLGNAGAIAAASQTIDISGYLPRAMTAVLRWYERSIGGAATVACDLIALDGGGGVLATASQAATAAPTAVWDPRVLTLTLPANTAKLKVKYTIDSTLGSPAAVTETRLQVGTFNDNVLANPSFESGTASWTVDLGAWTTAATIASPSANYGTGGAAADSTIHQDYALPTGWEVGSTAVLECWRAQTIASDTGKVTLQVLDASNVVISTVDTTTENFSTLNVWNKRRLSVEVTGAAAKIRVILNAHRTAGAGNSGAAFDEIILQVHKHLTDPSYYRALVFDTPPVQPVAATWQEWHLEHPDIYATGIADPSVFAGGSISSKLNPTSSLAMVWSDGTLHPTQLGEPLVGAFGNSKSSITAYRFARQSGAGALDFVSSNEGTARFANPTSSTSFTAIVLFRVDESGFATACGLVGRRDSSSGWGLEIDATGHVKAILQGTGGTKTAVRTGSTVIDGALHMAAIVYDAVGHSVTVYDERGNNVTSTVTGLGEIANTAAACLFRIGRDTTTLDTLPGMIGRVYVFNAALTSGQIAAHWNYAKDPTAALTTYTKSVESWTPGATSTSGVLGNVNDATLVKTAIDQVALGYTTSLITDFGTGWGLAVAKGSTNIVPSSDFTNATVWIPDSTVVLTQGIVDATGKRKGVRVVADTTHGLDMRTVTIGAGANMALSFYARCLAGANNVDVLLFNSSGVLKQTITKTFGPSWQRQNVQFTAWDASTATAIVKFRPSAASITFDLTHMMWAAAATDFAAVWPEPGATLADVTAALSESLPAQFNPEGEVIATGVATQASPSQLAIATVDCVTNGSKNRRELMIGAAEVPRFDHTDSAAASNTSSGTAIDWSQVWNIRGRWCSIKTLDNAANAFAGIVVDEGSALSAVYGRAATWTYDAIIDNRLRIGVGTNAAINAYLRRVVVRAREEKLV